MKVRASVKKLCRNCKIVKRKGILRVICADPRQMQTEFSCHQGGSRQDLFDPTDLARFQPHLDAVWMGWRFGQ